MPPPAPVGKYIYIGKLNQVMNMVDFQRRKREEENLMELGITHMYYKETKSVISVPETVLKERGHMNADGDYIGNVSNHRDYVVGENRPGWD